jgi:hypothetical protein
MKSQWTPLGSSFCMAGGKAGDPQGLELEYRSVTM